MDAEGCTSETGDFNTPSDPACQTSLVQQRILVRADANGFGQRGENYESTTGYLAKQIRIRQRPDPTVASKFVQTRFAGEFIYEGRLSAAANGVEPAVTAVVLNFKVVDEIGGFLADDVIGSRIVLSEELAFDADLGVLSDGQTNMVQGSAAFDFAVDLVPDRDYRIVVELNCSVEIAGLAVVPLEGVYCDFIADTGPLGNPLGNTPGVFVKPITITVSDDPLERTLPEFDEVDLRLQSAINFLEFIQTLVLDLGGDTDALLVDTAAIRSDTQNILTGVNQALTDLTAISQSLDVLHDKIMDFRTAFDTASANATAERQELNDLSKEIIRLLHTPTGIRTSDVDACNGADCDFPDN